MSKTQANERELEQLVGKVKTITYRNEETGWTVVRLSLHSGATAVAVGVMPQIFEGEEVECQGTWSNHARYGLQFKVEIMESKSGRGPMDRETLVAYLGSGILPGVKVAMASRLVNHFGEKVLDVLDNNPERLGEVPGFSAERVKKIAEAWKEEQASRDALLFLCGLGLSVRMARRIYNIYQVHTVEKIKANPYRLAEDVDGIGFQKADAIARRMGIPADSPFRYEAGVIQALKNARGLGHVYLPLGELLKSATEDVLRTDNTNAARDAVYRLAELARRQVVIENTQDAPVYLATMYDSEVQCAKLLLHMLSEPCSALAEDDATGNAIPWRDMVDKSDEQLTIQQRNAVLMALTNKMSIVTGGPGTGKSFTMRSVINALLRAGKSFALAAPTGRAAKRLSEATSHSASTIHRLLEYKRGDGESAYFHRNQDRPLNVDMLIVDEASMIDLKLFEHLLKALRPTTHLLLVGDADQLPAVGAGDVLRDLIRSERIPVTRLGTIFRQVANSAIITNAHRVNRGYMPQLDNKTPDFEFIPAQDADVAASLALNTMLKLQQDGFDPLQEVQVLTPMRRGAAGVDVLNARLQQQFTPPAPGRDEYVTKTTTFRVGDKVMQQVNNYDLEVWNGDIGYITEINRQDRLLLVRVDERVVEYSFDDLDQITLAYASTIHKSQGSEYPVVITIILPQHWIMLQKNLLYTALTRAKRQLVLIGAQQAIARCVKNDEPTRRYTALTQRLCSETR